MSVFKYVLIHEKFSTFEFTTKFKNKKIDNRRVKIVLE